MPRAVGTYLGPYHIVALIGAGGIDEVSRAGTQQRPLAGGDA